MCMRLLLIKIKISGMSGMPPKLKKHTQKNTKAYSKIMTVWVFLLLQSCNNYVKIRLYYSHCSKYKH